MATRSALAVLRLMASSSLVGDSTRKISWFYSLQNFVHEIGGSAGIRNQTRPITDEFTSAYLLALACDRRQACGKRQFRNPRSCTEQNGVARHNHSLNSGARKRLEG